MLPHTVLMSNIPGKIDHVYGRENLEWLKRNTRLHSETITNQNLETQLPLLDRAEAIFSTWGMLPLLEAQIAFMPKLKAVFYAVGSVSSFAEPFLKRNIAVCSAVEANAVPVAEFCLGQILLSLKGYFRNARLAKSGKWHDAGKVVGPGVYGETVALLGIGSISRHVLKLLNNFNVRVVADPTRRVRAYEKTEFVSEAGTKKPATSQESCRG